MILIRLYESAEQQETDRNNWNDYFAAINWSGFKVGDALNIGVRAECNNGTEYKFSNAEIVSLISDNEDVVKFSGNVMNVTGNGNAKITVTVDYHGIYETKEIDVTVTE